MAVYYFQRVNLYSFISNLFSFEYEWITILVFKNLSVKQFLTTELQNGKLVLKINTMLIFPDNCSLMIFRS
jgi:hypothetical protein